jgi:hypothetical protein
MLATLEAQRARLAGERARFPTLQLTPRMAGRDPVEAPIRSAPMPGAAGQRRTPGAAAGSGVPGPPPDLAPRPRPPEALPRWIRDRTAVWAEIRGRRSRRLSSAQADRGAASPPSRQTPIFRRLIEERPPVLSRPARSPPPDREAVELEGLRRRIVRRNRATGAPPTRAPERWRCRHTTSATPAPRRADFERAATFSGPSSGT